jgi:hypothetical protein
LDNVIIEKCAKLLGTPKNNVKDIFQDKTDDEGIQLLNDIESALMLDITNRLNLYEVYESFINQSITNYYIDKNILNNMNITSVYLKNELLMKEVFSAASKEAKELFTDWIHDNNKFNKINYSGKNITSRCSKLPHVPHCDINNKTFCCGVNGDIELIDYTIKITSMINKINGTRSKPSRVKGAYQIQIIKSRG